MLAPELSRRNEAEAKPYPETMQASGSQVSAKTLDSITPKITELISVTIGVILIFRATEDLIKCNE